MKVGVPDLRRHAARPTCAAGCAIWILAEKQASEPEPNLLLANASRAVEQEARWKRIPGDCLAKTLARGVVAVEGQKWHEAEDRERRSTRLRGPLPI